MAVNLLLSAIFGALGGSAEEAFSGATKAREHVLTSGGTLRDRIVRVARQLAPLPRPGDDATYSLFESAVLGGTTTTAGVYRYYSDGYGTTCVLFAAAVLDLAGAPRSVVDRSIEAKGGYGQPFLARMIGGAKELGWYRDDIAGLAPGDVYCVHRPDPQPGVDPTHVGVVLSVTGDIIVTADGGQSCQIGGSKKQCSKIIERKRDTNAKTLAGLYGPGPFQWRIAPEGP